MELCEAVRRQGLSTIALVPRADDIVCWYGDLDSSTLLHLVGGVRRVLKTLACISC
jgi:hypothetical protein